ncbi:unnamed protein product [Cunninghamella blakesleeana]
MNQSANFDTSINCFKDIPSINYNLDTLFTVEYHNWYKVVINHAANKRYVVVCCGQIPSKNKFDPKEYDFLLQLQDKVQFIKNHLEATSPCYSNVTQDNAKVDVVFASSETNLRINKVIFSANDNRLTPLAKARWLVYLSVFFDKEALALDIFDKISQEYNCHKSNVASIQQSASIAWTSYKNSEPHIYKDLYFQQITKDAGANLVLPSIPIQFHQDIHQAEIVIDETNLAKELSNGNSGNVDYEDWLEKGEFIPNTVSFDQPFIYKKSLYRLDGLVDEYGFEDWLQRSAARPDLVLTDIIHLHNPSYDNDYKYVWLRNFAKGDHARMISKDNYNCENLLIMNTCKPTNGGGVDDDSKKYTYGKNNVGIIIGLLAAAGLVSGGIMFYRNWKRQQTVEYFQLNNF